jgi:hypothetical protein
MNNKIDHEETKETKKDRQKTFVLFVSSWLIPEGAFMSRCDALKQ